MMEGNKGEVRKLGEFWHICTVGGDDSWSSEGCRQSEKLRGHRLKFLGGNRGSRFC